MNERGIVWLASYPKSGNTWVRCLISSLQSGASHVDLANLGQAMPNAASRTWLERYVEVDNGDLLPAELERLRASAYRCCAAQGSALLKVHDRYDARLFPAAATLGTVYIVRDPRDVAPSWADHMRVDVDTAIAQMGDADLLMSRGSAGYQPQTPQRYSAWSSHVVSWLQEAPGPHLLLRYEALLAHPLREAARLAAFLGLPTAPARIARAVAACRFDALRDAEERDGFSERRRGQQRFFRQGQAGAWHAALDAAQVARLRADHGVVMAWLGYH
ncbi:sulfotransferase domain-containing protein [Xanthomonas cassavae CFBP 4642]|uniref:Sulfotransferase domain-containing protein n=1 Tax=Xanthomonas cassavae CFBP 4642 TaxID=1219375 RepID=A0ABS8HC08_9XANT|nr:sulfotransferase domain-containing protein [Xanthomonas cassavae]MCC4619708.1 sulfotransferase domain-containing protein [Xanthomonas cassavae CFBP 4642]